MNFTDLFATSGGAALANVPIASPSTPGRRGWVYFAKNESGTSIKIGFSGKPRERLKTLNVTEEEPISFIGLFQGSIDDEAWLHARFRPQRIRGDWYTEGGELRSWIDSLDLVSLSDAVKTDRPPLRGDEPSVACPCCGRMLTPEQVRDFRAFLNGLDRQSYGGGRPPVLRDCKKCGGQHGAREMRACKGKTE